MEILTPPGRAVRRGTTALGLALLLTGLVGSGTEWLVTGIFWTLLALVLLRRLARRPGGGRSGQAVVGGTPAGP